MKIYRNRTSFYIALLILISAIIAFNYRNYWRVEPENYGDIKSFREDFFEKFPEGTPEEKIEAYYVSELNYKKSAHWHYDSNNQIATYVRGDDKKDYLVTYITSDPKEKNALNGYFFTLRFSLEGELVNIEYKGSTFSKVGLSLVSSMFEGK